MKNNELDGLIALKLVAEKQNFSLAARLLGITPSAISQSIKQLEHRLGVALLSRTTRATRLTEAGERFLATAGPAIEQIQTAIGTASSYSLKPSGLLRINLPKVVYTSFLAPRLTSFFKKHPEISVELFFEDSLADVVSSGFDAGIRLSDILEKDMTAVKLFGPVRFIVVGSPKYFLKQPRPKHPRDLLAHQCLPIRLSPTRVYDSWEFEHRGKEFHVEVKGRFVTNDFFVLLDACRDGAGLMYTTEDSIKDEVQSGRLEIVLSTYAGVSSGFYLYFPKRSQVQPKLRAFIEHIRES